MRKDSVAILFFSRTFEDEFKVKNLGFSKDKFKTYYQFQVNRTLEIANESGLPVFEHYSDQQKGDSFGERLSNALRNIKNQGFDHAIILGNDTPLLTLEHIESAKQNLQKKRSVVGKDQHNGAWIIGLELNDQLINQMELIAWQDNHVYRQLVSFLPEAVSLNDSLDLNHTFDLKLLFKSGSLLKSIRRFLISIKSRWVNCEWTNEFHLSFYRLSFSLRGPPELL